MADLARKIETPMDPIVLARLTGGLGDQKMLNRLAGEIGALYTDFLPDVFESETGLPIEVSYQGCESGLFSDLVSRIGSNFSTVDVSLRNWCPHFLIAGGNSLAISLMATMLGALPEEIDVPEERPLSKIELDAAALIFSKVAGVLRSAITVPGGFEPILSTPVNHPDRVAGELEKAAGFALAVRFSIKLNPVESDIVLIVPQKTLLKTRITPPKSGSIGNRASKDWADHLTEQVRRSHVMLEARIQLTPLKLGTIARLAVGDVIPFFDEEDVHVEVAANGHELYACEFGRSGQNYTVRIKDNTTSDEELLRHLLKG
ncbi:FliM/FliN family flagellar motor switch protein [Rhizobiaceae bacterium BDR2-2]|uniref:Flagellar motor switch protein FliM n=1 Tax=Ectorhizobium quercum TaxID=2965071 RepID=A0AAE3STG5_9HYPH|nr:FliM/FliN family flagellar motor switch protein [Ectorhizobium quercum]MCX8996095.1 FliM/FliN family flagellar motor switch protein [Ectorhizobium quercum]